MTSKSSPAELTTTTKVFIFWLWLAASSVWAQKSLNVDDLENKASKSPESIIDIALAASSADPATAVELNELQALLLDKYKNKFFAQWNKLPKGKSEKLQKLRDFVLLIPQSDSNSQSRIKIFESRIALLKSAPASLKSETAPLIEALNVQIQKEKKGSFDTKAEGDIVFKASDLRKLLVEKLEKQNGVEQSKIMALANEILLDEGLNFKGYIKSTDKNWNICSASTSQVAGACHNASVGFTQSQDSCGKFALMGIIFQTDKFWFVMSGSSSYRIPQSEVLSTSSATLIKAGAPYHTWNMPDGFSPEGLTPDLHNLYARTTLRNKEGRKISQLHLLLRDNGRFQFGEVPKNLIQFTTNSETQDVTALDGARLEFRFPQKCSN